MQIAPWQTAFPAGFPQGLTWTSNIQNPTLLTQGNQIFIRGPQQDQQMIIHSTAPPQQIPHNRKYCIVNYFESVKFFLILLLLQKCKDNN